MAVLAGGNVDRMTGGVLSSVRLLKYADDVDEDDDDVSEMAANFSAWEVVIDSSCILSCAFSWWEDNNCLF